MSLNIATTGTGILKTVYLPELQELLPNATPLLKQIQKEIMPVEGNNFRFAIHRQRNEAAGVGVAELGTQPTAGEQRSVQATVTPKYIYSAISVSGPVIEAAKSNKGAFVRAIDSEVQGVMRDTKRSLNRQLNGDGRDALAFWVAADDTSGTNMDDNLGNGATHLPSAGTVTCDAIDVSDDSTVLDTDIVVTRGTVGSDSTAVTWTGGPSAGTADGDYLVIANTLGLQLTGINASVAAVNPPLIAGGLHGLPVTTYPDWVSLVIGADTTVVDFTFTLLDQAITRINTESDREVGDELYIHVSPNIRSTIAKAAVDQRMFFNNMKLDGGWNAINYNGIPVMDDVQCRRNTIFVLTPSKLSLGQMAPLQWMEKDGSMFYRLSGGDVDGYGGRLFMYCELVNKARNQHAKILGLRETWR